MKTLKLYDGTISMTGAEMLDLLEGMKKLIEQENELIDKLIDIDAYHFVMEWNMLSNDQQILVSNKPRQSEFELRNMLSENQKEQDGIIETFITKLGFKKESVELFIAQEIR